MVSSPLEEVRLVAESGVERRGERDALCSSPSVGRRARIPFQKSKKFSFFLQGERGRSIPSIDTNANGVSPASSWARLRASPDT